MVSKVSAKSCTPAVCRPFPEQDIAEGLSSQTSQATTRRAPGRPRGTGTRRGRGGLATSGQTTLAPSASEELSDLATDIDPDSNISGPPRRSGRTAKPSRTILEEQEIQREVANTNTEQKARQIRRLEATELIKEFLLKYGS